MSDELGDALGELAVALNRNRERIDRIVDRAGHLLAARDEGLSWTEAMEREHGALVIELIGQNLDELYTAGGWVRRALAAALHDEGMSMDQIARRFGVTRQRVSALLRAGAAARPPGIGTTPPD